MPVTTLTTKEVARLLNISEATVKRWADDGTLSSEKTAGGHRRFDLHEVKQWRRDHAADPKLTEATVPASPMIGADLFCSLILRGDEGDVTTALIAEYVHGHTLSAIFDGPVAGAMKEIGELWLRGGITIAQEHLATRLVISALQQLRGVLRPAPPTGLRAICCGVEGDLHELPVQMVQLVLEGLGWQVLNLGPNTPLFTLREMVLQERPHFVCISARMLLDPDRTTREFAELRRAASKMGTILAVGGEALRDQTLRARFPADLYARKFSELEEFIRSLTDRLTSTAPRLS